MEKSKSLWVKKAISKKSVKNKSILLKNTALIQKMINLSEQPNDYLINDENAVIEACKDFNENVINRINPSAYKKYQKEISNLEKSAYDFVTCKKKNWNNLLCSVLKSANITQETINMLSLKNNDPNQQIDIPNLETKEEDKNL